MTFKQAQDLGIANKLDSLYEGGINSDSTKAIFKNQAVYIESYQQFIEDLASFLAKNNFKWGKQVRCFNRIYFAPNGSVDHFLYSFSDGQISDEQNIAFSKLLEEFCKTAQFKLKADRPFAQCSPVRYND